MSRSYNCPICNVKPSREADLKNNEVECAICGRYSITFEAIEMLSEFGAKSKERLILKHYIINKAPAHIDDGLIDHIVKYERVPKVIEQINNLIIHLGDQTKTIGQLIPVNAQMAYKVGITPNAMGGMLNTLVEKKLILHKSGSENCSLTFDGWEKYEQILTTAAKSKTVFMAMQYYDNEELKKFVDDGLRPILAALDLTLHLLGDEGARAGILDDHLRVDIRSSKFMIADLTHLNKNVYWEAGFAEGLGKKVIFTCEESKSNDAIHRVFNINHIRYVKWNIEDYTIATKEMESVILNSFPELIATKNKLKRKQ